MITNFHKSLILLADPESNYGSEIAKKDYLQVFRMIVN